MLDTCNILRCRFSRFCPLFENVVNRIRQRAARTDLPTPLGSLGPMLPCYSDSRVLRHFHRDDFFREVVPVLFLTHRY